MMIDDRFDTFYRRSSTERFFDFLLTSRSIYDIMMIEGERMSELDLVVERFKEKIKKVEKVEKTPKIMKKGKTLYIVRR